MTPREKLQLGLICTAGALAGGLAVLALDATGLIAIPRPPGAQMAEAVIETPAPVVAPLRPSVTSDPERAPLAYMPTHALPMLVDPVEGDGDTPIGDWSSELHSAPVTVSQGPGRAMQGGRTGMPQGPVTAAPQKTYTLMERLAEIGPDANKRLSEKFAAAKASWPPTEMGLVALKDEKVLDLYARANGGGWTFIHRYPVLAASGVTGPKLRQGDKQVPEGVYSISFLNPNSRYHVSLRVNYPNAFDREMASKDGRKELGGDIMIHGKAVSVGCLAVGDAAAEELFVLAAQTGLPNVKLVIAPTDLRRDGAPVPTPGQPGWVPGLYGEIKTAMAEFPPAPMSVGLLSFISNLGK